MIFDFFLLWGRALDYLPDETFSGADSSVKTFKARVISTKLARSGIGGVFDGPKGIDDKLLATNELPAAASTRAEPFSGANILTTRLHLPSMCDDDGETDCVPPGQSRRRSLRILTARSCVIAVDHVFARPGSNIIIIIVVGERKNTHE